ncbi:putative ArsR family transcriptional regulator [Arthrobacter stackebrandtii]|uniref:ArsR family transcriptional regulator n=1 Tax=Arthrobacter stackebrandtii TaxID=272161 RepID=A0ABS4YW34_9MICC|nr:helix-turn-helix domain-containing protein [Arthrobacter stackebrandtii]MBP2412971.1 putative ArsR family transcriptional regulator [Arthrobacter stackebrandtii]PYH01239.1 transcriptional regulator [Arthrobacter stackebrandtii]
MENKSVTSLPQGPKPSRVEPVAPISKARAAILAYLREIPDTLSVEQLAARTGQHANTVREHLEALVSDGHATKTAAPREGRGRPAWLYEAATVPSGPVGYAALAVALAQHIAATSSNPAAEGEDAGRTWARALPKSGKASGGARAGTKVPGRSGVAASGAAPAEASPAVPATVAPAAAKAARGRVVSALGQAGFGVQGNRDATELTLTTCPIVEAARENPEVVCAVHLGLAKELLADTGLPEDGVRLLPFAGPGFCTLHLPAAGPAASGTE